MNKRHAFLKALKQTWWTFFCALIIVGALIYLGPLSMAPWWAFAVVVVSLVVLCSFDVIEKYREIQRDQYII